LKIKWKKVALATMGRRPSRPPFSLLRSATEGVLLGRRRLAFFGVQSQDDGTRQNQPTGGLFTDGAASFSLGRGGGFFAEAKELKWLWVPFLLFGVTAGAYWRQIHTRNKNLQGTLKPGHLVGLLIGISILFVVSTSNSQNQAGAEATSAISWPDDLPWEPSVVYSFGAAAVLLSACALHRCVRAGVQRPRRRRRHKRRQRH